VEQNASQSTLFKGTCFQKQLPKKTGHFVIFPSNDRPADLCQVVLGSGLSCLDAHHCGGLHLGDASDPRGQCQGNAQSPAGPGALAVAHGGACVRFTGKKMEEERDLWDVMEYQRI